MAVLTVLGNFHIAVQNLRAPVSENQRKLQLIPFKRSRLLFCKGNNARHIKTACNHEITFCGLMGEKVLNTKTSLFSRRKNNFRRSYSNVMNSIFRHATQWKTAFNTVTGFSIHLFLMRISVHTYPISLVLFRISRVYAFCHRISNPHHTPYWNRDADRNYTKD